MSNQEKLIRISRGITLEILLEHCIARALQDLDADRLYNAGKIILGEDHPTVIKMGKWIKEMDNEN